MPLILFLLLPISRAMLTRMMILLRRDAATLPPLRRRDAIAIITPPRHIIFAALRRTPMPRRRYQPPFDYAAAANPPCRLATPLLPCRHWLPRRYAARHAIYAIIIISVARRSPPDSCCRYILIEEARWLTRLSPPTRFYCHAF
jgi:hypothetical protein